jgi:uncharacterized membrane protein
MSDAEVERTTESRRLDAFVDAAFAFAVTLLLVAGADTTATLDGLKRALLQIPASAAAFVLVALFWSAHRDYGRMAPRRDGLSTLLSLAIVFSVLVYVFPLRMLVSSGFHWISGGRLPGSTLIRSLSDLSDLFFLYGLGFAFLGLLFVALFTHVARRGEAVGASAAQREQAAEHAAVWLISSLAGIVSALLAMFGPMRQAPWIPGFAYWLIPIAIWTRLALVQAAKRRRARKAAAEQAA